MMNFHIEYIYLLNVQVKTDYQRESVSRPVCTQVILSMLKVEKPFRDSIHGMLKMEEEMPSFCCRQ